jgi:HD-like signal output (HDOD) protein
METIPIKTKALFVDDEQFLIQGLQRLLRPLRDEWDITFVTSAHDAIALLVKEEFSVLVTDMRMPAMNGAELLHEVVKLRPSTMRIILSGQADLDSILSSICTSHQYIAKPCDGDDLKHLLTKIRALRQSVNNQQLQSFISQITHIPCQPDIYDAFFAELSVEAPSLTKLSQYVCQDIGMTVRILQIANSSCLNQKNEIFCPAQAVTLLGVELLKSLVNISGIFKKYEALADQGITDKSAAALKALNMNSILVSNAARQTALLEKAPENIVNLHASAGLLHDIGKIILMLFEPEKYLAVLLPDANKGFVNVENSREFGLFGTTHNEVGAYFLGLWGLPDQIVEAVGSYAEDDIV